MDRGVEFCPLCEEPILNADAISPTLFSGKRAHHECAFRAVVGGANHIKRLCSCYGGTLDQDPPGLTYRQCGRAALDAFEELNPRLKSFRKPGSK